MSQRLLLPLPTPLSKSHHLEHLVLLLISDFRKYRKFAASNSIILQSDTRLAVFVYFIR